MQFTAHCETPLGGVTLASDGESLTGLWFDGQKYFGAELCSAPIERELPVFEKVREWLQVYFRGENPVGHNPASLIVPCHRVLGADGSLTGYAGGVERKRRLLELEGCCVGKSL